MFIFDVSPEQPNEMPVLMVQMEECAGVECRNARPQRCDPSVADGLFRRGVLFVALLGGSLVLASTARAASFDCTKAGTKVEKMICTYLSKEDDEMYVAYKWALMRVEDKQQVIKAQKAWLKTRDVCEEDMACLSDAYSQRIRVLEEQVKRPGCYTLEPILDGGTSGKVRPIEPVCEVLEQNLNRFCDQPPMVCGLKIAPEFRDKITLPKWKPIESKDNLALIEEFIRAPWREYPNHFDQNRWDEERPVIEKAIKENRLSFTQSNLDLYNLGQAQPAYRLDYGDCKANNPGLNKQEMWSGLNIQPAPVQIHHSPEVVRRLFSQYFPLENSAFDEVLLYDGKVYDYGMWSHAPESRESDDAETAENRPWYIGLWVDRHERWTNPGVKEERLIMKNICRFQYQPIQTQQTTQ